MSIRACLAGIACCILVSLAAPAAQAAQPTPEADAPSRVFFQSQSLAEFAPDVAAYLSEREGLTGAALAIPSLGVVYTTDRSATFHLASVAKVMIMLTLLDQAAQTGEDLTPYQTALLEPMIIDSDNDAADALWEGVGGGDAIASYLQGVGIEGIQPDPEGYWGASLASPDALAVLLARLIQGETLDERYRAVAMHLMSQVHPDWRWGATAGLPYYLPPEWTVGVKDGWNPGDDGWWVTSVGFFIPGNDQPAYTLAILTNEQPSWDYGEETVETVAAMLHDRMALLGAPQP